MSKHRQRSETILHTCEAPSQYDVYHAAKAYVQSGLSLIPIRADGSKQPAFELLPQVWCPLRRRASRKWGVYRERQPTLEEITDWFNTGAGDYGMAILAGAVSGNVEIIDLDNWSVVEPWIDRVKTAAPKLFQKLVCVKTPRPGMHVYYRCFTVSGNQKLARAPDPEQSDLKPKTIIEVKGEGGYCLAPPSPAGCHKSGRCYLLDGKRDLTQLATITPEEREVLLACARSLNTWQDVARHKQYSPRQQSVFHFGRPGDDFNARADWAEILTPHGWRFHCEGGDDSDHWTRPGKSTACSATTNFKGTGLLYVFSSNADPFEERTGYTKFHAYTLLEHKGDFSAAASALAALGYGQRSLKGQSYHNPFKRYASYRKRESSPQS